MNVTDWCGFFNKRPEGIPLINEKDIEFRCSSRLCGRKNEVVASKTRLDRIWTVVIAVGIVGVLVGSVCIFASEKPAINLTGLVTMVVSGTFATTFSICLILYCRVLGKEVKNISSVKALNNK